MHILSHCSLETPTQVWVNIGSVNGNKKCWLPINDVLWHSPESIFTTGAQGTILYMFAYYTFPLCHMLLFSLCGWGGVGGVIMGVGLGLGLWFCVCVCVCVWGGGGGGGIMWCNYDTDSCSAKVNTEKYICILVRWVASQDKSPGWVTKIVLTDGVRFLARRIHACTQANMYARIYVWGFFFKYLRFNIVFKRLILK